MNNECDKIYQTDSQSDSRRSTNLELFRIISMMFIVAHHYVVNSGMMDNMSENPFAPNSLFFYLFGAWGKVGINCFIMITGYFMCKSHITLRKFVKLLLQIEFYRAIIYLIFVFLGYEIRSKRQFLLALIPIKTIGDGFTSAFLVFFLFIPFLNVLLKNISEKMHIRLIILCLFLYTFLGTLPLPYFKVTMNYVSWFVVIYFISSYVRLHPRKLFDSSLFWGIASAICVIISSLSIIWCLKRSWSAYYFIAVSNKILAVITSFCLFMFFKNVRIPYIRTINLIASASFGVLLIHANSDAMRMWLWKDTLHNAEVFSANTCYLHFICSVLGVYSICTIIDLIRIYLLEKPFFKYYDRYSTKLISMFSSFEDNLLNKLNIES